MTIGPKALKDMIDHFPNTKSAKSDPQLTWAFDESEVRVRSFETSVDMKGENKRRPNTIGCSPTQHPFTGGIGPIFNLTRFIQVAAS